MRAIRFIRFNSSVLLHQRYSIACWDGKYRYVFWRPLPAIRAGDTDGNPSTDPDPNWTLWLDFFPSGTPPHPEYPSGHSTQNGSAAFILAAAFGDATPFTVISNVRPGTRSFPSFSAAVSEIADARLPRHSLQDFMRSRESARASRGGLRLDPRAARFGWQLRTRSNSKRELSGEHSADQMWRGADAELFLSSASLPLLRNFRRFTVYSKRREP